MKYSDLNKEEQDAFHQIKKAFNPISDETALEYTQAAIQLAKVGEVTYISGKEMGEALKRVGLAFE